MTNIPRVTVTVVTISRHWPSCCHPGAPEPGEAGDQQREGERHPVPRVPPQPASVPAARVRLSAGQTGFIIVNVCSDRVSQVCNSVYLRLNFSTPLCACPEPGDPCSASTLATDNHSLRLSADTKSKQVSQSEPGPMAHWPMRGRQSRYLGGVDCDDSPPLNNHCQGVFVLPECGGASGESGTAECWSLVTVRLGCRQCILSWRSILTNRLEFSRHF